MKEDIPFVAFGNDELEDAPALGDTVKCGNCGEEHEVEKAYGEQGTGFFLNIIRCGDKSFLCGINGKAV